MSINSNSIIDCHVHIFPLEIVHRREKYFEDEPAFKWLYNSPKAKMATVDDLLKVMDAQGIDRAVVFGFGWRHSDTFKRHNDYVIESVAKYADRLKSFCCFDPLCKDGVKEVARCASAGLSGVGELGFYLSKMDQRAIEALKPVMAFCLEKDFPILLHCNEPIGHVYAGKTDTTIAELYNLLKTFPENKIILAHWGGGLFFFHLLKKEVKDVLKNVYYDTAASPFLYDPSIYTIACEIIGADKILFGSDYPLIDFKRYFKEMDEAGLNEENRQKICGENVACLLGL